MTLNYNIGFLMKVFITALTLLASMSSFARDFSVRKLDLPINSESIKIENARIAFMGWPLAYSQIKGCQQTAENYPENCLDYSYVYHQEVIEVSVSYVDSTLASEGNSLSYATFILDPNNYMELYNLRYSSHKADEGKKFIAGLKLKIEKVPRTISIVDMAKSQLCPLNGETSEKEPGCVESLKYKNATKYVKEVTIIEENSIGLVTR
jgi:hypothetical protein